MNNFAIIGNPISHTLSPEIFKLIFDQFQINATYNAVSINNNNALIDFINNKQSLLGFNVTLPYKEIICKYIDELDEISSLINSVNCVKRIDNKLIGCNTDYFGFNQLLDLSNINFNDVDILILGNGGVARTISYLMLQKYKKDIFIWGRDIIKTEQLINTLNSTRLKKYSNIKNKQWIIINCLSLNIEKNDINYIIDFIPLNDIKTFIDVNYLETKLTTIIKKNKCEVIMGQDMLIFQALESFNIWFDYKFDTKSCYKEIKN